MRITLFSFLIVFGAGTLLAQQPDWINSPGKHADGHFVSVGVSKHKKVDKARAEAEKRARKGMRKLLKRKYDKDKVKQAVSHMVFESYWRDGETKYTYVLAKLAHEHVDSGVAGAKLLDKAKSGAMEAAGIMKKEMQEPEYIIVDEDEEDDEDDE